MNEVVRAMSDMTERFKDHSCDEEVRPLQDASKAWAVMALSTFSGDMLKRALDVSVAISQFTCQFELEKFGKSRE